MLECSCCASECPGPTALFLGLSPPGAQHAAHTCSPALPAPNMYSSTLLSEFLMGLLDREQLQSCSEKCTVCHGLAQTEVCVAIISFMNVSVLWTGDCEASSTCIILDKPLFVSFKETEEPVVECQECETDMSSSRTAGGSSLTSGDLGDVSSFSSKASSLHRTSSGGSSGHSATHSSSSSSGRGAGAVKGKVCGTEAGEFALPIGRGVLGKLR